MKLRIFSDLHHEFYALGYDVASLIPPHVHDNQTIGCFIGDIGLYSRPETMIPFFEKMLDQFAYVLFVAGNHEFYRSSFHDKLDFDHKRFFHLNNSAVPINGVRFVGSTFWTDMDNDPMVELEVGAKMNDFRLIKDFSTYIARKSHRAAKRYIRDTVQASEEPCVVLTHHAPDMQSINEERYGSISNPIHRGYASDCSELLERIADNILLWAHGHTHASADYIGPGGIRIVANPRGYPIEKLTSGGYTYENYEYDPYFSVYV